MSKIETEVIEGYNGLGEKYSIRHIKGKSMKTARHGVSTWVDKNGFIFIYSYRMGERHGKSTDPVLNTYYIHGNKVTEGEFRRYELIEELAGIGNEDE